MLRKLGPGVQKVFRFSSRDVRMRERERERTGDGYRDSDPYH
jgi:hypothetical protein